MSLFFKLILFSITIKNLMMVAMLKNGLLFILIMCPVFSVQAVEKHYLVDADHSSVYVLVYKEGALQLLGHNHVMSHSKVRGKVVRDTINIEKNRFILEMSVNQFIVDDKDSRQKSGDAFTSSIDSEDALATRDNMLRTEVLDSENHPDIVIRGYIKQDNAQYFAHADINIKGVIKKLILPIDLQFGGNSVVIKGRFSVKQTDFDIQPFSLMGGMLAVQDSMDIIFDISLKSQ